MRVLMLGTLVPDDINKYCFSKGQRPSAADIAQKYMLQGLETLQDIKQVDVIGAVRLPVWPKSAIFRIKKSAEKREKGVTLGVGYLNIPPISFFLREAAIIRAAKKWAKQYRGEQDVIVLIYSMHSPFMKAARAIKEIIPTARLVLTVADLPLFMDMRSAIRRMLKKIDWIQIKRLMKKIDKYLLYTKYMAEYLQLNKEQWMVFEGIIDENKIVEEKQAKASSRFALYAGNLDSRYGIDQLISAFSFLSEDEKLYIYGAGFDTERIGHLAQEQNNVEYKGQVTQDEIFEIMKQASLLINPRPANIGLAKYSCPSKTFEYLASGTPVIMNRLPGIPDEYYKYVYLFTGETVDDYARCIHELFSKSDEELQSFGLKGAAFLKDQKTSSVQMKKVLNFVKE